MINTVKGHLHFHLSEKGLELRPFSQVLSKCGMWPSISENFLKASTKLAHQVQKDSGGHLVPVASPHLPRPPSHPHSTDGTTLHS